MVGSTMSDDRVVKALNRDFVSVLVDFDEHPDLVAKHKIKEIPAVVYVGPDGTVLGRSVENADPEEILTDLDDALWELRGDEEGEEEEDGGDDGM